ncbi:MAG TPA: hypothetical protein PLU81_13290 [Deltaproteobacteria bacterium]|nr:hypothetical protein [Deltaproteobacteria bacterium]
MKKVWLTSLEKSEENVKQIMSALKGYGLDVQGHFWTDELEKMAWIGPRDVMLDKDLALWAILASPESLSNPSIRYGLSLLAVTVQSQRGLNFPIVILQTGGETISSDKLMTPLQGADVLAADSPAFGAKIVAKVHAPGKKAAAEYRLDCYGNPQIGQWFEIGPAGSTWNGALFGVAGAKITFQAVGPKGQLPEKSTLNYPIQDMQLGLGEKEYIAWAVQNELGPDSSYFVRVEGHPDSILFGEYSQEEEADVFVVSLK